MKPKYCLILVTTCVLFALASVGAAPAADQPTSGVAADVPEGGTVAYYFHGNVRCSTCRKLEAYSMEAVEDGFAAEIAAGGLEWRAVNVDEPMNKHFVDDFELVTKALVLVEYSDGEVARWQDLKLIWQLVRDKDGYLTYVREATADFLEAE